MEKLQIYADLSALIGRTGAALVEPRLLVQQHSEDLPQAAGLLAAALIEGKMILIHCTLQKTQSLQFFTFFIFAIQDNATTIRINNHSFPE